MVAQKLLSFGGLTKNLSVALLISTSQPLSRKLVISRVRNSQQSVSICPSTTNLFTCSDSASSSLAILRPTACGSDCKPALQGWT